MKVLNLPLLIYLYWKQSFIAGSLFCHNQNELISISVRCVLVVNEEVWNLNLYFTSITSFAYDMFFEYLEFDSKWYCCLVYSLLHLLLGHSPTPIDQHLMEIMLKWMILLTRQWLSLKSAKIKVCLKFGSSWSLLK